MPVFSYRARDKEGRLHFGVELAPSKEEAANRLIERGLWVIEVKEHREHPMKQLGAWAYETFNLFRPRAKHYAVFFRSLSSALSAGMTAHEALHMLSSYAPHGALRKMASEGKLLASSKIALSQVFMRHPHLFPKLVISIIQVGEESGRLDAALNLLADYYERDHEHSLELKRETFYPIMLGVFVIVYLCGLQPLIGWLTGKMSFLEFTLTLLKGLAKYALIIAACYFIIRGLLSLPLFRLLVDALILSLPLIGGVRRRLVEARFLRALAMLQASGVDAARSISLAGEASGSRVLEVCCNKAASMVREGKRLSESLTIASKHLIAIQPTTLQMLSTAEMTGSLDDLLPRLANQYEQEAFTGLRQRAVAIGVLLLLIAAIIIGAQVISFYAGYYSKVLGGE
ncbi:MAG: type II secretion system F family protein [Armatimonadota bacterium]|nr:type II secretion system F family protein [Armatimonadota bacterium]MCX7777748.1 type II secretion system F family protein [Armatimonadota bacterium]MDW8026198.1 type II secretion system F family protein [Armatimonadota bacterium]